MRTMFLAIAAAAALSGCEPELRSQAFRPTENVQGSTIQGLKEAFYDLAAGPERLGQVKVWSPGATTVRLGGRDATEITVGFTIDNSSDAPIALDAARVRLDRVETQDGPVVGVRPTRIEGPTMIAPRASADVVAVFDVVNTAPDRVLGFRVSWTTGAGGQRYTEFTPFVQEPTYAYVPIDSYYDPFFDPYWYHPWGGGRIVFVHPHHHVVIVR